MAAAVALLAAGAFVLPAGVQAQHQHHHDHGDAHAHHDHAGGPVECRTLAGPPWSGLPGNDLELVRRVEASVAQFANPEAARAAGFRPAFGHIPTMGVHWIHAGRMARGFNVDEPDHLMFARIGDREELVGVAFAFMGSLDAEVPTAFESELAAWHDHPELGPRDQTLHMLHVWFVDSPYGPFAGNNFALPYGVRGIAAPDPCWLTSDEEVERFELVASTLSLLAQLGDDEGRAVEPGAIGALRGPLRDQFQRGLERLEGWEVALDVAARNGDHHGWVRAAEGLLGALRPAELRAVENVRALVKGVQEPGALRQGG